MVIVILNFTSYRLCGLSQKSSTFKAIQSVARVLTPGSMALVDQNSVWDRNLGETSRMNNDSDNCYRTAMGKKNSNPVMERL